MVEKAVYCMKCKIRIKMPSSFGFISVGGGDEYYEYEDGLLCKDCKRKLDSK